MKLHTRNRRKMRKARQAKDANRLLSTLHTSNDVNAAQLVAVFQGDINAVPARWGISVLAFAVTQRMPLTIKALSARGDVDAQRQICAVSGFRDLWHDYKQQSVLSSLLASFPALLHVNMKLPAVYLLQALRRLEIRDADTWIMLGCDPTECKLTNDSLAALLLKDYAQKHLRTQWLRACVGVAF